jgi:hypothetical protein
VTATVAAPRAYAHTVDLPGIPEEPVMPLFGEKKANAGDEMARASVERMTGLPAAELAAVLMPAFGTDGPKPGDTLQLRDLAQVVLHTCEVRFSEFSSYRDMLDQPLLEAVQMLEHAELVCVQPRYSGSGSGTRFLAAEWSATRFGLATLANGKDAVRQRITDRTGL